MKRSCRRVVHVLLNFRAHAPCEQVSWRALRGWSGVGGLASVIGRTAAPHNSTINSSPMDCKTAPIRR